MLQNKNKWILLLFRLLKNMLCEPRDLGVLLIEILFHVSILVLDIQLIYYYQLEVPVKS